MTAGKNTYTHNNKFKSRFLFLQEAHRSKFHSKLLIWGTDVHRSDVNDGQARCFGGLVVDDRLAPSAAVRL